MEKFRKHLLDNYPKPDGFNWSLTLQIHAFIEGEIPSIDEVCKDLPNDKANEVLDTVEKLLKRQKKEMDAERKKFEKFAGKTIQDIARFKTEQALREAENEQQRQSNEKRCEFYEENL